jgi:hypothetical protein
MQGEVNLAAGSYGMTIHGDVVPCGINFGPQFGDTLTIYGHASLANDLLATAARSHSSFG